MLADGLQCLTIERSIASFLVGKHAARHLLFALIELDAKARRKAFDLLDRSFDERETRAQATALVEGDNVPRKALGETLHIGHAGDDCNAKTRTVPAHDDSGRA